MTLIQLGNPLQSLTHASPSLLPPRRRAVLILREVLDWRAREVAHLLGLSIPAVNSALHSARTTMAKHYRADGREALSLVPEDEAIRTLLNVCVHAWETGNLAELIALLTDDAMLAMPPTPTWYRRSARSSRPACLRVSAT